MKILVRFILIFVVLILAGMLILEVGGALTSTQLWHSALKVVELAGVLLVASGLVLVLAKESTSSRKK